MKRLLLVTIFVCLHKVFFAQQYKLKHGDLLFQQLECGSFCEAVMKVTPAFQGEYYSHVGMVVEKNNQLFVLEAISKGVCLTPLDSFIQRTGSDKIRKGRIPKAFIPNYSAIVSYLGKPYDSVFDIHNEAYYCSELVYLLCKNKPNQYFFHLSPMTFKDPETKALFPVWKEYFDKMNVPIPEGKPGLSPGSMMNEKRIKIERLKY